MPSPKYCKVNCHTPVRARPTSSKHLCFPVKDESFSASPAFLRTVVEL